MSNDFLNSLGQNQRIIHDALCESSYLSGLKAGWNAGTIADWKLAEQQYQKLVESRTGYLDGYREAKRRLEAGYD